MRRNLYIYFWMEFSYTYYFEPIMSAKRIAKMSSLLDNYRNISILLEF